MDERLGPHNGSVHVALGCEMDNRADPMFVKESSYQILIGNIALDEGVPWRALDVREVMERSRIRQQIERDHM